MRFTFGALIITLVAAGTVQAQSLADIARAERARRVDAAPGRLINNENISVSLSTLALAPPPVERDQQGPGADEVSQESSEEVREEARDEVVASEEEWAEWEAVVAEQRSVVQSLEDRELRQQLEMNRIRNLFTAPVTTQAERAQAQAGLDQAQAQLDSIRMELEEARTALEEILAQEPGGIQ